MKLTSYLSALSLAAMLATSSAVADVSKVWVSDNGNGTYTNPIIDADYSDPDVCRVGDDYYMTSSSFNCLPGLQILHSKDLVNWTLIGAAIPDKYPGAEWMEKVQHGNGVWAPSIRHHNGEFYIYYGDPDKGIYMTKATNPAGPWSELHLVEGGLGIIDTCPLWDEDGNAYMVYGHAGSRSGHKSTLLVAPMAPDGKSLIGPARIIFDGHEEHPTVEGPKFYKKDGYYYILCPAGGVSTGWQLALRSKSPYGPYEEKIVMAQGSTDINGPHQGAWVDTPNGEHWFIHFQDKEAYGRVVHLNPLKWVNGWPVIGEDKNGDGCGEPVKTYKKPNLPKQPIATPAESDEFNDNALGLQWQWHGNPSQFWIFNNERDGVMRLYSVPQSPDYKNLGDSHNLLMQKFPTENFVATTKLTFAPNPQLKDKGERAGLVIMGLDYATLSLVDTKEGIFLQQTVCKRMRKGTEEVVNESVKLTPDKKKKDDKSPYTKVTVYLRSKVENVKGEAVCTFYYSTDGKNFKQFGQSFEAKPGQWIGAKIGYFCNRPIKNNDGGFIDVDWFRVTKK